MRELIESLYTCTIIEWETFDGDTFRFAAIQHGRLIVADSVELLILALAPITQLRAAA